MKKTNKIKKVTGVGTWDGQYGMMYRFEVEMENGDAGQVLTKKEQQETYVTGDTIDYEFTDGKFPKIKRIFENSFNNSSTPKSNNVNQDIIVRQVAFKGAVEFVCSQGGDLNKILDYTDIFNKFILTGEKPTISSEMPF
jgi:hypothetical protein